MTTGLRKVLGFACIDSYTVAGADPFICTCRRDWQPPPRPSVEQRLERQLIGDGSPRHQRLDSERCLEPTRALKQSLSST